MALSGVDCAGKSTQRDLLVEALRSSGRELVTVYTRPGYTPGLRAIKSAARALRGGKRTARDGVSSDPSRYPRRAANLPGPIGRWLWLTAALLDLLLLYAVRIRLWRARGRAVLCNRYLLDALVDFRVNFPADEVEKRWLCRLVRRFAARPDAAFCLLIPAEQSMERARAKARFHWETLDVLEERWREYRSLCAELEVQVLDGGRPVDELARAIQERVAEVPRADRAAPAPGRVPGRQLANLRE